MEKVSQNFMKELLRYTEPRFFQITTYEEVLMMAGKASTPIRGVRIILNSANQGKILRQASLL